MARKINPKITKNTPLPYKLYCFVCEDEKSMQHYLQGIKDRFDGKKIVIQTEKAPKGSDAKHVEQRADEKQKKLKGVKDSFPNGYVVVSCFDKDANKLADIKNIMSKVARHSDRAVIYNNPCYEYWLLLHTKQTSRGFTSSDQCCHETMKAINSHYHQNFEDLDKFKKAKNIFDIVGKDLPKAIQNAKSLNFSNDDLDGTYTNAHLVLEEIIKMAE